MDGSFLKFGSCAGRQARIALIGDNKQVNQIVDPHVSLILAGPVDGTIPLLSVGAIRHLWSGLSSRPRNPITERKGHASSQPILTRQKPGQSGETGLLTRGMPATLRVANITCIHHGAQNVTCH